MPARRPSTAQIARGPPLKGTKSPFSRILAWTVKPQAKISRVVFFLLEAAIEVSLSCFWAVLSVLVNGVDRNIMESKLGQVLTVVYMKELWFLGAEIRLFYERIW